MIVMVASYGVAVDCGGGHDVSDSYGVGVGCVFQQRFVSMSTSVWTHSMVALSRLPTHREIWFTAGVAADLVLSHCNKVPLKLDTPMACVDVCTFPGSAVSDTKNAFTNFDHAEFNCFIHALPCGCNVGQGLARMRRVYQQQVHVVQH